MIRLEDVLNTSWRCLEDVLKTSWRRLEDVLKTYSQDEYIGLHQDVLKTSSEDIRLRWTYSSWSDVFKTSSEEEYERHLHQDECLLGQAWWDNPRQATKITNHICKWGSSGEILIIFIKTLVAMINIPVDTRRKLNLHKTFWTSSERLMYVQFTSCVYGVAN